MDAVTSSTGPNEPRSVAADRGVAWWTDAWALFTKNAVMWVVLGLIVLIILLVLAFIPLLGQLASALLLPVFVGSWMTAAQKVEGGGTLEPADLFTAFKGERLVPLIVIGALFLVMMVVTFLVMGVLGFGGAMSMATGNVKGMMAGMGVSLLAVLVGFTLFMLATMTLWFAPALVALRGVAPVDAMRLSFAASLKNLVPFLLWGLIYFIASIIATLLLGLGWLVLVPVLMLTAYLSYKDVFAS